MSIIEANGGDIETYLRRYISRDLPGAWIDKRTGLIHPALHTSPTNGVGRNALGAVCAATLRPPLVSAQRAGAGQPDARAKQTTLIARAVLS
jgi:hypothetical protein